MIILTNEEKVIDKIKHPLMIKTLGTLRTEGNDLNKDLVWKAHGQHNNQQFKKLNIFPLIPGRHSYHFYSAQY